VKDNKPIDLAGLHGKLSKSGIDLCTKLLDKNGAKRITASEALAHDFFNILKKEKPEVRLKESSVSV